MFPGDGLLFVSDTLHLLQAVGAVKCTQLAGVELVEKFQETRLHLLDFTVSWKLRGLSLPLLLPLLPLLLLLVGDETPAGETVPGPGVVERETDAVVPGVIPVRLQVMSVVLRAGWQSLYDGGGVTGQEIWPGYEGRGQLADERVGRAKDGGGGGQQLLPLTGHGWLCRQQLVSGSVAQL